MKRVIKIVLLLTTLVLFTYLSNSTSGQTRRGGQPGSPGGTPNSCPPTDEASKIQRGFEIAPVPLNLRGRNSDLVGLGSYIVNAQAACADCHSCPTYAPGHNPFEGGDGQINAANYLGGGVPFGPVISANITPDDTGKPAGLTFEEYLHLIRTGEDEDEPGEKLQVMPWPIFRNMTDHDIRAIYEYLTAIPHAEPGSCSGPGQ
jgi:hypothetical protein